MRAALLLLALFVAGCKSSSPEPVQIVPISQGSRESQNDALFKKFEADGDKMEKSRPVDFAVVFFSDADRTAFLAEMRTKGYQPNPGYEEAREGTYWVEITTPSTLVRKDVMGKVAFFEEAAIRHHGEFDGWAAPVVK